MAAPVGGVAATTAAQPTGVARVSIVQHIDGVPAFASVDEFRAWVAGFDDIPVELVEVDAWKGVKVEVRGMTGDAHASHMARLSGDGGKVNWKKLSPSLLRDTCYVPVFDEYGEYLAGQSTHKLFEGWGDEQINAKSAAALQQLARVAQRLSGLEAPVEEDEDEEAEG